MGVEEELGGVGGYGGGCWGHVAERCGVYGEWTNQRPGDSSRFGPLSLLRREFELYSYYNTNRLARLVAQELVSLINDVLGDKSAPRVIRHQALQLALVFVCGVNQLSPGAYFLRRDLFPAIVTVSFPTVFVVFLFNELLQIIKSPETEQYAFEAALLLGLLANFHKSDAAYLNPYLKCIHETEDKELMRTICWAANFAAEAAVKFVSRTLPSDISGVANMYLGRVYRAYQSLLDDSPPTAIPSVGSLLGLLRPEHVLADPPRDLFNHQCVQFFFSMKCCLC
jgi:hypothetical protein